MTGQNYVQEIDQQSPIDIFAMSQFEYQYRDLFILNIANQAVVANAITPQAPLFAL